MQEKFVTPEPAPKSPEGVYEPPRLTLGEVGLEGVSTAQLKAAVTPNSRSGYNPNTSDPDGS